MMCYPPTGYIMFSLKLKFYGGRKPDMTAGGRITQTLYSVLNKLSEYIYFCISKIITSYTFVACF